MSPTTYGYGQSSGSSQGVNYTIAVTSPTGANTYEIVAWKGDKVVSFVDMGLTAQSRTGSATTLNTTLLINTIVADIAQLPPTTSSTTHATTTMQTTTVQSSTGSSQLNILQQIWSAITNFFSHL